MDHKALPYAYRLSLAVSGYAAFLGWVIGILLVIGIPLYEHANEGPVRMLVLAAAGVSTVLIGAALVAVYTRLRMRHSCDGSLITPPSDIRVDADRILAARFSVEQRTGESLLVVHQCGEQFFASEDRQPAQVVTICGRIM